VGTRGIFISAVSTLVGPVNFLGFYVPSEYRLVTIGYEPEVNSIVRIGEYAWVTDGYASYLLTDGSRGVVLELHVDSRRSLGRGVSRLISGHPGVVDRYVRRSIFSSNPEARIEFYCDITMRRIRMILRGRHAHEFSEKISGIICH
jgi:hypothetical protein